MTVRGPEGPKRTCKVATAAEFIGGKYEGPICPNFATEAMRIFRKKDAYERDFRLCPHHLDALSKEMKKASAQ